jgi:membrane-associated phospholipid phosphatase
LEQSDLAILTVSLLQSTIGYYRPNYYAHPAGGNAAWPSGHSALSTGLFLFLSLWMAGKTHLFFSSHALYLLVLCFCPLVLALVISASRIHDYFHSPADVISGMSFGAFVAILSYMTIYHSLFSPLSGLPVNRQNPHWHNKNEQEVVAEPLAEIQPDPPSPGDEMRFQVEPAVVRAAPSV